MSYQIAATIVREISYSPRDYALMSESFRPIRHQLAAALGSVISRESLRAPERETAANLLIEYGYDQVDVLCRVLMDAEASLFEKLLPCVGLRANVAVPILRSKIDLSLADSRNEAARETLAGQQANAAIAVLRLSSVGLLSDIHVWPLFSRQPFPNASSWFAHRALDYGVDPKQLIKKINAPPRTENTALVQAVLLQCLGQYDESTLPVAERQQLVPLLLQIYANHPDPAVHASAGWVLQRWSRSKEDSGEFALSVQRSLEKSLHPPGTAERRWEVNSLDQTFAVLDASEFRMGTPAGSHSGAGSDEDVHTRVLGASSRLELRR